MHGRRRALVSVTVLVALLSPAGAGSEEYPPQVARGLTVPAGFAAVPFGQVPELTTSLTWGADTTADARDDHGILLYVTATRNPFGPGDAPLDGKVFAFTDEGGQPTQVAGGLDQPLGIVMGPDQTLYVSENDSGPGRGRITALRDTDADGQFETRRTVLKNLPNGRHQTNGMTFGPDGMLYVANGNATDDGIECGPNFGPDVENRVGELPPPLHDIYNDNFRNVECPAGHVERKPWTGAILRVDPAWTDVDLLTDVTVDDDPFYGTVDENGDLDPTVLDDEKVLVSPGYRNIYDVDFNPRIPNEIWTPMNGSDDPSSSEPLYALPVDNEQVVGFDEETQEPILGPVIEDAGFPMCLYDAHINPFPEPTGIPIVDPGHKHPGDPTPGNNPNPAVQEKFGQCPVQTVIRPRDIYDEGHEGTAGLAFERGNNFPARYDGDLFTAEWGSLWNLNGATVTGHKIIHHDIRPDGTVEREREFMSGILPMDVTFGPDGYMYVADMPGQIYQVRFVQEITEDVVEVDIVDQTNSGAPVFDPQVVALVQGQTVRWCNRDDAPHNIDSRQKIMVDHPTQGNPTPTGDEINSPGVLAQDQCHSHTFEGETASYVVGSNAPTIEGTISIAPMVR